MKALGVHFTYNKEESLQKNYYDKLADIKRQIHLWSWRGLSLLGKISTIKSLLLPKLIVIFSILSPTTDFIALIQMIIYKFLWKGPDKVKRTATINNFANGGLNLTDLDTLIKSLRLAWIAKLSNAEPSLWKNYLKYLLKRYGEFFFCIVTIIFMTMILSQSFIQKCYSGGPNFAQQLLRKVHLTSQ